MKMKTVVAIAAVLLFAGIAQVASAQEYHNRKKFFVSVGPAVGGEALSLKQVIGGGRVRIGGGVLDNLVLYLDESVLITKSHGDWFLLNTGQARVQYFFYENLYGTVGGGYGLGRESYSSGADGTWTDIPHPATKFGYSVGCGFGYEFHIKHNFIMAPEVTLDYSRIHRTNFLVPAAVLNIGWYLF